MTILPAERLQTPMYSPPVTPSSLLEKTMVETQCFYIDGGKSTLVVGQSGIRITLPALACRDATGLPPGGDIRLELTELVNKGEMIAAGMSNAAENHLLESAVVFHLQAQSADGSFLFFETPVEVDIPIDESRYNPFAFQLYCAGQSSLQSFTASSALPNWKKATPEKLSLRRIHGRIYLHGAITSTGWWSCATPVSVKGKQYMISAKCIFPEPLAGAQMTAFLALHRSNTVMRMYEGKHHFSSFNVPLKLPARLLAVGHEGDKLYFSETLLNSSQVFYYLYMQEVDAASLAAYLNKL
ncbi:MAG: hypothetical protein IPN33_26950 [Saprospiraceae bacterium]|nr:hypothetical protein [Saprospiraceae bacterium]